MQLASHGARRVSNFIPRGGGLLPARSSTARSFHIPSFVPRARPTPAAQRLIAQSRHLIARFFAQLTAPGLSAAPASAVGGAIRTRTIHQGLSLPVRHALARPLGAPQLPRAPTLPRPNCVTNVGLGTARNFHAARPLFQNVVENVPVAGRAFWEADWDIKMREEQILMAKPVKEAKECKGGKEMLKPKHEVLKADKENQAPVQSDYEKEMEHYFPAPVAPEVTTYLLVPLAPTPTSRAPLAPSPIPSSAAHQSLLPLPALAALHASHSTHALRVSSLFARLDASEVWSRGAACSAYGDARGVCTILKVEFKGWTEKEVRGVIGESGSGWCALEEVKMGGVHEDEGILSEMSSELGDERSEVGFEDMNPAQSFVLPTLDFSSSFIAASSSSLPPSSPSRSPSSPSDISASTDLFSYSDCDSDLGSEFSRESEDSIDSSPPSASSWMGFSSEFTGRLHQDEFLDRSRENIVY